MDSLRSYGWNDLRVDVIAGLSVAAVAVPQAMAYAMIAGLPAEYGLYTAIVMTAVGATCDCSTRAPRHSCRSAHSSRSMRPRPRIGPPSTMP